MMRLLFCLPILGTLLLISCKSPEPIPVGGELDLLYQEWTLVELDGKTPPNGWEAMTLSLTDSARLSLVSSCNLGSAAYELTSEGDISISQIGLTKRGCASNDRADWEMSYIEALENASRFGVDSESLYLWHELTLMRFE